MLDDPGFLDAVAKASESALGGRIGTFGMIPDHAATGYGYTLPGEAMGAGIYSVARFVEKPDAATTEGYIQEDYFLE